MLKLRLLVAIAIAATAAPAPAAEESSIYVHVSKVCDFKSGMCVVPLKLLILLWEANQSLGDALDEERANKTKKCGILEVLPKRRA